MKKVLFLGCLLFSLAGYSQSADSLHKVARNYMWSGDYPNAIFVLNNALKLDPDNLDLQKDLAFTYYLQKNYSASVETGRKLINRKDADEQCYQILGMAYKAIEEKKEADKMYRQGIKKFPNSGVLYNEYGEILWATRQVPEAIQLWEKGIAVDPSYPSNYYNACKYYDGGPDKIWAVLYGEIFINMESYSKRTPEIKNLLADAYKKLFNDLRNAKNLQNKNPFIAAVLTTMNDQSAAVAQGITPESIGVLRSKFILEWFDKYAGKYPFHLFEYERQLMKEGLFDAYNQWIFGPATGLATFQNWTVQHAEDYNRFITFQKGRVFKLPANQNYRDETAK